MEFLRQHKIVPHWRYTRFRTKERDQVLVCFANRSPITLRLLPMLPREAWIKQLDAVIKYDLAKESAVHIHRIGHPAARGAQAVTLNIVAPQDTPALRIEDLTTTPIKMHPLCPTQNTPCGRSSNGDADYQRRQKIQTARAGDVLVRAHQRRRYF